MNALRYDNRDLQMPPSGKLSESVLADFEKWIAMGAQDPRNSSLDEVFAVGGLKAKSLEEGRKFWAFKPIKLPSLPDVQTDELREIQKDVTLYGFGMGYTMKMVDEEVKNELETAASYRLKEMAEDMGLELEYEFIGLK